MVKIRYFLLAFARILFLIFLSISLYAGENIYLDNEEIQEYKGKTGLWMHIDSPAELISCSKKFSTDVEEIYILNNIFLIFY